MKIDNKYHRSAKQIKRPFGFNVIGYVSRNIGLGVMSRNLIRIILDKNYPVAIYDFNPPEVFGKQNDLSYKKYFVRAVDKLPYSINLFTIPLRDASELFFSEISQLLKRRNCLNVFCPMWELAVLPNIWIKALQLCDLIVAQTDFVRSTCERYLPDMPIISANHPMYLPKNIKPSRARFGLPKDAIIFIYSFEPRSGNERKNPTAAIYAFKRAFRGPSHARLVIKINNASANGIVHPIVKEIERLRAADQRIHLITEDLSYYEILKLYASCDVFVSLHRSEGLGLALMEAMQMGKPVIATAWSGNMTFMSYRNSCPVRYKLIPAKGSVKCYNRKFIGKDAFWADPDIEDAALWMRRLAQDDGLRHRIGKKAAADMAVFQKQAKKGHFIEDIQAIWENQYDKKS